VHAATFIPKLSARADLACAHGSAHKITVLCTMSCQSSWSISSSIRSTHVLTPMGRRMHPAAFILHLSALASLACARGSAHKSTISCTTYGQSSSSMSTCCRSAQVLMQIGPVRARCHFHSKAFRACRCRLCAWIGPCEHVRMHHVMSVQLEHVEMLQIGTCADTDWAAACMPMPPH
jgi:hypothetical protein